MHESEVGGPDSDLGGGLDPIDEQLVRIQALRVAHASARALVVTVTGQIDWLTVDRLRAAVGAEFEDLRDGEMFVIDLTQVTFIDSHGLQALVDLTHATQQQDELLRIVVDYTGPVIRPIKVTRLDDVLTLFDTVEDALQAPL